MITATLLLRRFEYLPVPQRKTIVGRRTIVTFTFSTYIFLDFSTAVVHFFKISSFDCFVKMRNGDVVTCITDRMVVAIHWTDTFDRSKIVFFTITTCFRNWRYWIRKIHRRHRCFMDCFWFSMTFRFEFVSVLVFHRFRFRFSFPSVVFCHSRSLCSWTRFRYW